MAAAAPILIFHNAGCHGSGSWNLVVTPGAPPPAHPFRRSSKRREDRGRTMRSVVRPLSSVHGAAALGASADAPVAVALLGNARAIGNARASSSAG